jgi:hypothetical protein
VGCTGNVWSNLLVVQVVNDELEVNWRARARTLLGAGVVSVLRWSRGGVPEPDLMTMGYRHRDHFVEPRPMHMLFDRTGDASSVLLIDGRVAASRTSPSNRSRE